MERILQEVITGLTRGASYALVALGYTMVYGIIQLINFAHGDVYMVGAFAGLAAAAYILPNLGIANDDYFLALPIVFGVAILVCCLVGFTLERVAYRPLRNAPRLAPLLTALGASIVIEQAVRNFYPGGTRPQNFPGDGPPLFPRTSFTLLGGKVIVPYLWVFIIGVAIAMMVGLLVFIRGTRTGKAMRASAQDRDAALLMGINIDRIIVITFLIGSGLAAVGGVLVAMYIGQVNFFMGFGAGLKAFTAAVLGGIGNIRGAMVGGFVLGLVESLASAYFGQAWADVWAFGVLVAVLVFRPTGLFGERVAA